jgi:hypothetical protein
MKAVAIIPRKGGSIHLREVPKPSVGDVEGGRGVEVPADKINPGFVLGLLTETKNSIKVIVKVAEP